MRVKVTIIATLFAVTMPLACKIKTTTNAAVTKATSLNALEIGPACKSACADESDESKWAVCYSCRCKAAMDGWLPSPEEVSCNAGREIPIYQALDEPDGMALQKVNTPVDECFNPPRLINAQKISGGCIPGSKLGQLKHNNIRAKWICRRESLSDKLFDSNEKYDDHGMILHNETTGATCFYDDIDHSTNGNNNPDIDLTSGDERKVTDFLNTYYKQEGNNCIGCHDNDPFMYSPYLKGAGWETSEAYTLGKYFAVHASGEEKSHVVSLTAEKAAPCLTCHRIGQRNTCKIFAEDSAGLRPPPGLHKWLKAPPPWGSAKDPSGHKWPFPAWMPVVDDEQQSTKGEWASNYGEAINTIITCCNNPTAPGCTWENL